MKNFNTPLSAITEGSYSKLGLNRSDVFDLAEMTLGLAALRINPVLCKMIDGAVERCAIRKDKIVDNSLINIDQMDRRRLLSPALSQILSDCKKGRSNHHIKLLGQDGVLHKSLRTLNLEDMRFLPNEKSRIELTLAILVFRAAQQAILVGGKKPAVRLANIPRPVAAPQTHQHG